MDHVISTPALRAAIRFSITATWRAPTSDDTLSISSSGTDGELPQGNSPGLRKLVEGILFSRKLILSYNAAVLGILIVVTTIHWVGQLQRWRRRKTARDSKLSRGSELPATHSSTQTEIVRNPNDGGGYTSSSSSSTLQGIGTPPSEVKIDNDATEESALLSKHHNASKSRQRSYILSHIRAWLSYQPRPVHVVDKTLPSNATTLAVLGLLGLNVFYVFYRVPFSVPMLFVFADRTSLLFVANLPLLYLFAAKNQPIKMLTGYSYESLNIIHRRLGEVMCLLALLHSAGMVGVWYTLLRPTGFTFARFIFSRIILLGIGAFLAYEIIYLTSLGSFRQRWYELFLGMHILLQVVALILVWFHHSNSRVYVGLALAIFAIDRIVYRLTIKAMTSTARVKIFEDQETIALSVVVPLRQNKELRNICGSNLNSGWKSTEHVFLTVPALARKHIFQAHPFTIASQAPSSSDSKAEVDLIIRAQDGFSADLMRYARSHKTVNVRLDGPYGSQSAVRLLQDSDRAVVIAGGSGIAVAWPLVWSLVGVTNNVDLEHRPAGNNPKRVLLVWVVHKQSQYSWIGKEKLDVLKTTGVDVMLPEPTAENGRPDVGSIIETWLDAQESLDYRGTARVGVVCSGPDGMNRAVRNRCSSLMARGRDVGVEVEKFGW